MAASAGALLLTMAGTATAAGPGETFLVGGLPLPAGAIAGGSAGGGDEVEPIAVSADGRYVAFVALADGLSPDAGPDVANVFRKDRLTGEVVFVSRADGVAGAAATRSSRSVTISADGSRVGFVTEAGLDPGDTDEQHDVYVRDVAAGRTLLMSGGIASDVYSYDLSGNGAFVAFATDAAIGGDDNVFIDVYRREIASGVTTLVSAIDGGTRPGDGHSSTPSISDDGRLVAFATYATNFGFTSAGANIALRDVANRRTALVSHPPLFPARGGNADSITPVIAGGAATLATAVVAFESDATNLSAEDGSSNASIYVGTTSGLQLASRADGAGGANADASVYAASLSNDGRRVAFSTHAENLGGTTDAYGVYVRDLAGGRTSPLASGSSYAVEAALSGDGSYVAWFDQDGANWGLDPELYPVLGRAYAPPPAALGAVEELSRPAGSTPWVSSAFRVEQSPIGGRTVSADGRYVVLVSSSRHLEGAGRQHVYRRDTLTGELTLVSRFDGPAGAPAVNGGGATISADGNRIAFTTESSIDPVDGGGDADVYVRDIAAGTTTLASRAPGAAGAPGDRGSFNGRLSSDGRRVGFLSSATNFGVAGGRRHVYVRDLAAGTTTVVDRADGDGPVADADAAELSLSADGSRVAYLTYAANLDPADPDTGSDVYVRDLPSGDTQLVSRRSGADGVKADRASSWPAISGDGRVVVFQGNDPLLAPEAGPWPANTSQIVARDLVTQQTTLVSRAPGGGAPAATNASEPSIDAGGDHVAFTSNATNLLPGRGGEVRSSVFVRTRSSGALDGPPAFGLPDNEPQNRAYGGALSADGQCLLFVGLGHTPFTGAAGDVETAYVHTVSGSCPKPLPLPRRDDPQPPPRRDGGRAAATRPVLSKVSLLRKRFRVGTGATALAAAKRKAKKPRRTPAGTAIRFTLNARANVIIAIERKGSGRKVGRQCRRATPRLRRRKACTRWTKVGALRRTGQDAGRRSVAFSGRLGRRALAPGAYRLTVTAANAAGSAKPATLAFTVVRR